jgi:hypothetical protein
MVMANRTHSHNLKRTARRDPDSSSFGGGCGARHVGASGGAARPERSGGTVRGAFIHVVFKLSDMRARRA